MARRVQTEQVFDDRGHAGEDEAAYNLDNLSDQDDLYGAEDEYGQEEAANGANAQQQPKNQEEGEDLINYKGIYFNDDPGQKFNDPETGVHFEYKDMCRRLNKLSQKRAAYDKQEVAKEEQDPVKAQQLALQKEKEEFLKSLGIPQQKKQETKQQQQVPKQLTGSFTQQMTGATGGTGYQQSQPQLSKQQQQLTEQSQHKENNKQMIASMMAQQQQMKQQQQQQQQLSQSKWRSKSNEKQTFLNSSQKIVTKAKASGLVDINNIQHVQKMIASKQVDLQRGKTPESYNNKPKVQVVDNSMSQTQQTIQKLKASLGYNDSTLSTGSNLNHQQQIQTNKTRSSQRSNRDKLQAKTAQSKAQTTYNIGSGSSNSRNAKGGISGNSTIYNKMTNKSQTMKKGQTTAGINNLSKQIPEIDHLMAKFNNSLAIQNIGGYAATNGIINSGGTQKSRNAVQGSFKTTASIGSAKGIGKQMLSSTQALAGEGVGQAAMKGAKASNQMIVTADNSSIAAANSSHGKKISTANNKFNQTMGGNANNSSLYSMIYQNRQKNLVSNYLKGIDGQVRGIQQQQQQKMVSSSRNQALIAPAATKKFARNTIEEMPTNKSLINRYY